MRKACMAALAALTATSAISPAVAATVSTNLGVRIVIEASCTVAAPSNLDFGVRGVLDANVDATTTVNVTCTNTLPYTVGLGAGGGTGATVTDRRMTGPSSATVNYAIYRDSARTLNWGNSTGTEIAGTGNGSVQPLTVYGRVPAQSTPAAGTYTDTVQVTVTY